LQWEIIRCKINSQEPNGISLEAFSMQALATVVTWEVGLFLGALATIVVFQILTGQISTKRLLFGRRRNGQVYLSPERIQLLVLTLAAAGQYVYLFLQDSSRSALPEVPQSTLALLGGSHGIYLGGKAWAMLRNPKTRFPR
jgi:hypothetical protein